MMQTVLINLIKAMEARFAYPCKKVWTKRLFAACDLTSSSLFYPLANGNLQQTDKTA
jgi:hypothetical protein